MFLVLLMVSMLSGFGTPAAPQTKKDWEWTNKTRSG